MTFSGDVFTDGPAYNPQCAEVRRAGWAVVQVSRDGTVTKALYGHVPADASIEQTAGAGEIHTARRAAELAVGAITVHAD